MQLLNRYSPILFILGSLTLCSQSAWPNDYSSATMEFKEVLSKFSERTKIYESNLSNMCSSPSNFNKLDPDFNKLKELVKLLKAKIALLESSQDTFTISLVDNEMQKISPMCSFLYARISGDHRFDRDYASAPSNLNRDSDLGVS